MSKPKHYRRGKGYYVSYGCKPSDMDQAKGAMTYSENVRIEIHCLEKKGDARKLDKLRGYLNKSLYSRLNNPLQ
jgi:hypothetical protein